MSSMSRNIVSILKRIRFKVRQIPALKTARIGDAFGNMNGCRDVNISKVQQMKFSLLYSTSTMEV